MKRELNELSAKFAALTISAEKAEKDHTRDMVDTDSITPPRPSSRTIAYG